MSTLLEVALGLVLMFFAVSLLASIVAEWLSAIFAIRGKLLWEGIANMLNDPNPRLDPRWRTLADDLCKHPLICSLIRTTWFDDVLPARADRSKPSYVSAQTFSAALLGILGAPDFGVAATTLPADHRLRKALDPLVNQANGDMAQARKNVELWFDAVMARATGWYKRWSQVVLFPAAFVLAVLVGVDTLHLARELWSNEPLRRGMAEAAEAIGNDPECASAAAGEAGGACLDRLQELAQGLQVPLTPGFCGEHPWRRLLGFLLTALAASLGAPFWFDLLNRLVNLRAAGSRPKPPAPGEPTAPNPAAPAPVTPAASAAGG